MPHSLHSLADKNKTVTLTLKHLENGSSLCQTMNIKRNKKSQLETKHTHTHTHRAIRLPIKISQGAFDSMSVSDCSMNLHPVLLPYTLNAHTHTQSKEIGVSLMIKDKSAVKLNQHTQTL